MRKDAKTAKAKSGTSERDKARPGRQEEGSVTPSSRGRSSTSVNWRFEEDGASAQNWMNKIIQGIEASTSQIPPSQGGSDTDSLETEDETESTSTENISQDDSTISRYSCITKSTRKEKYIVSRSGKRSPFLKVNMVPPSPATENMKQSIEDIRYSLLAMPSAPKNRKSRSRRYDTHGMRSEFLIDASTGNSSRRGDSMLPSLLSQGSEYYSVSHRYEIVQHHCKKLSCETLPRDQFYQMYIQPERYLRDIWVLTENCARIDNQSKSLVSSNQEIPRLWTFLVSAHTLPIEEKSKFYWQKHKRTNDPPCLAFNQGNAQCDTAEETHGSHYCLCCGSEAHGAASCNVIHVLEKLLRHFAKKCGMNSKNFEKALGLHGDTPSYVVTHRVMQEESVYPRVGYSDNVRFIDRRPEQQNRGTDIFSNSDFLTSSDGSTDASLSVEEESESEATSSSDELFELSEDTAQRSSQENSLRAPSPRKNHPQTPLVDSIEASAKEPPKAKKPPKAPRAPSRALTKEFTKASYEAALHRRSDQSFGIFMLCIVLSLAFYIYFYLRDPASNPEYIYDGY